MSSIKCDDGEIPMLNNHYSTFLDKTTILYGSSGSGKSVLIKHIMYILKNYIPNVIIISPTNTMNNTFTGIVPNVLIYKKVDIQLLLMIKQRQEESVHIDNLINNKEKLESVFKKCALSKDNEICQELIKLKNKKIMQCEYNTALSDIKKNDYKSNINKKHQENLIKFYKLTIKKRFQNKDIKSMNNLSIDEKKIIKFIDFNPNFLLVLDDCAADAKEWGKDPEIENLFFNGRHFRMTTIISLQDEQILNPRIRSNAFNSIFTTPKCAKAYFNRATNNFSSKDRKLYDKYIEMVFHKSEITKDGDEIKNFKKLVYIREDQTNPIHYIIGEIYNNFQFGSKELYNLTERCQDKDKKKANTIFSRAFQI